jgi:hypothetical protein
VQIVLGRQSYGAKRRQSVVICPSGVICTEFTPQSGVRHLASPSFASCHLAFGRHLASPSFASRHLLSLIVLQLNDPGSVFQSNDHFSGISLFT